MLLIFCLGAGLTYTFGKMVRDTRQGWAIFATMSVLFLAGAFICYWAEQRGNTTSAKYGLETTYDGAQPGGNMEGKEVRFGNAMTRALRDRDNRRQLRRRHRYARQL